MIRNRFFRFSVLTLTSTAFVVAGARGAEEAAAKAQFKIKVTPVGLSQEQLDAFERTLLQSKALAPLLQGTNYRLLYTDTLGATGALPATNFRAVFYNYTRQEAIVAEGSLGNPAAAVAHAMKNWQPEPNDVEFDDAVAVLKSDRNFGPALQVRGLVAYRPMPPVQGWVEDAVTERIVNVGLRPRLVAGDFKHEIVGVNIARRTVVHYPGGAPRHASALLAQCGPPSAGQSTTRRGTPGQYQLTILDSDDTVLWDMLVLRPAISSGTNASGLELQNVTYKGHSVFKRAHVPILNVLYVDGECGPYRDWEYQEGMFQADGSDIAPGFRDCGTTPATTLVDTDNDTGNFRGVAIYQQGTEVFLVTEMEAGWYRYIMEWGFDADGTIHPRFGFGATANSCTCFPHTHHAYWRFDFDVDGTTNGIYELPLQTAPDAPGAVIATEKKIFRNDTGPMYYRIRGAARSYLLYPGANDGNADVYGQGDMWFLHWHDGPNPVAAEIDDGHGFFDPTEADLDQFLTGESIKKQDVVVWYHASFLHTPEDERGDGRPTRDGTQAPKIGGPEVVGPDLVPVGY